jgi:hypothetical protein
MQWATAANAQKMMLDPGAVSWWGTVDCQKQLLMVAHWSLLRWHGAVCGLRAKMFLVGCPKPVKTPPPIHGLLPTCLFAITSTLQVAPSSLLSS